MTSTNDNRFFFPAWGVSLMLHGFLVGLAFMFAAQVKPILPEDAFKWDVALVEGTKPDARLEQVESAVVQAQPPAKKVLPSQPKRVTETSQTVTQVEPQVEPPQPVEQRVEVPQVREEPVEQRVVEVDAPKPEPVIETKAPEPVVVASLPEPVTSTPVSSSDVPIVPETSPPALTQESAMNAASVLGHEAKVDNRWLAESLWRRVAELKRYPNSARMNGQEGKVILKAVIRSDGHLADVSIQRSSGYEALDLAAMEAVKLACPLHMKHAIGKPLIVVSLPIVYSLAN
jgi:protein TonB